MSETVGVERARAGDQMAASPIVGFRMAGDRRWRGLRKICLAIFGLAYAMAGAFGATPARASSVDVPCGSPAASAGFSLYGGRIAVPADLAASPFLAPALADLKLHLEMMTGTNFAISQEADRGGVVFALSSSASASDVARRALKDRGLEAFVLCGSSRRMEIVANDPHGLAHAVYFYLERLGVRWLLPSDRWTVAPHRQDIALPIGVMIEPDYRARAYFGTGAFWSWRWSRRYAGSAVSEARVNQWTRRLRYSASYRLGRAVGEAFIADRKILPILEQHPEYLAKVGGAHSPLYVTNALGQRAPNVDAKLNAGNPEAVALFCGWAIDRLRVARKGADRLVHDVFPVEPSDGYGYGDNVAELPGNGSGSDQTFHIANVCARKAAAEFPEASAILFAYAGHAAPPSFALESNVIVQVAPYAFQPTPPERFIAEWKAKARRLALYDYWGIPDWSFDEPTFDFMSLPSRLRYWFGNAIDGVTAESTYGAGAMGLGQYMAAHFMWNLGLDERAMTAEWFEAAFGPAQASVQRMYERWAKAFRLTSDEIARSLRDVDEARRLARGKQPEMRRLADIAAYVHYLRLRLELANAPDVEAKRARAFVLAEYMLDIDDRGMVHTTRNFDLLANRHPDVAKEFAMAEGAPPGPGWARVRPLNDDDIAGLIDDGLGTYNPPDWSQASYRGALRPVSKETGFAPDMRVLGPIMTVSGDLEADLFVRRGDGRLPMRISRGVDNELDVSDAAGRIVASRRISGGAPNEWDSFLLDLPAGEYRLRFHATGGRAAGHFGLQTAAGARLVLSRFLSPKIGPSPRLYFYVPRGLRKVVLYFPDSDFGGSFKLQIRDPSGAPVELRYTDNRRILEAAVPDGADGRVWSIENSVSPNVSFEMLTSPQAFTLSADAAMALEDAF